MFCKPKYRANIFNSLFSYFTCISISSPCRKDRFAVFTFHLKTRFLLIQVYERSDTPHWFVAMVLPLLYYFFHFVLKLNDKLLNSKKKRSVKTKQNITSPFLTFSDRNECMEENDCDDMAKCENTLKSYMCACTTKGFFGTGIECTGTKLYCLKKYPASQLPWKTYPATYQVRLLRREENRAYTCLIVLSFNRHRRMCE